MGTVRSTAEFLKRIGPPLLYIRLHILADSRSGWWVAVLTTYVIEITVYLLTDTWVSRELW